MRQIKIRVPDERREAIVGALEEADIDFVATMGDGPTADSWILEFPIPTDAVGDVLERLRSAGLEEDDYTVIGTAEVAMTPNSERLMQRYASNFDPLARPELRSKARDLSRDPTSYYAMIALSAVIATIGLLTGSSAVIVGSMVIAPFVGPILTASVGAVTDDSAMVVDSLRMQAGGLLLAVVVAAVTGYGFRFAFLVPPNLDLLFVDVISSRIAPNLTSVVVGLAAGGAAAYSLATKGPTALVGVMIAAALIPTAAAVGIGLVWGYPLLAFGGVLLLGSTVVVINAGVLTVLWTFGYRPKPSGGDSLRDVVPERTVVLSLLLLFVALGGAVGFATYTHATFERSTNQAVHEVLQEPQYAGLRIVETQTQYGGPTPLAGPKSVTVVLGAPAGESYPGVAADIQSRIAADSGTNVSVTVQFRTYQTPNRDAGTDSARVSTGEVVGFVDALGVRQVVGVEQRLVLVWKL